MTDNDIVKALECCVEGTSTACFECPFRLTPYTACKTLAEKQAIDLINRQKEEIERLKKYYFTHDYHECHNEAIKEFAERLKESAIDADVYSGYRKELFEKAVTVIEIDRILQEMTEGTKHD